MIPMSYVPTIHFCRDRISWAKHRSLLGKFPLPVYFDIMYLYKAYVQLMWFMFMFYNLNMVRLDNIIITFYISNFRKLYMIKWIQQSQLWQQCWYKHYWANNRHSKETHKWLMNYHVPLYCKWRVLYYSYIDSTDNSNHTYQLPISCTEVQFNVFHHIKPHKWHWILIIFSCFNAKGYRE